MIRLVSKLLLALELFILYIINRLAKFFQLQNCLWWLFYTYSWISLLERKFRKLWNWRNVPFWLRMPCLFISFILKCSEDISCIIHPNPLFVIKTVYFIWTAIVQILFWPTLHLILVLPFLKHIGYLFDKMPRTRFTNAHFKDI